MLTLLPAGGGSKDPPALYALGSPFEMKFHERKPVDFYSMSFTFDLKKNLALYVPRLIFGSPFLSEVTTISFTGECSYWTNLAFCWFRTRFCKACQNLTMGS